MPIKHKISHASLKVLGRLSAAGYEAYIVGGAVRDVLLGIEPKDYDVSTDATPGQIKRVFGRRAQIIGRRFQLVHVRMGRDVIEVSTFRRMPTLEERKGRTTDSGLTVWRDNEFGTLEDDATRRDFTVNAIYYDPINNPDKFVDLVGGIADLKSGVVRMIGDPAVRLAEDPVRLLRASKLAGQYSLTFEPNLAAQLTVCNPLISQCSPARMIEELRKLFRKPCSFPTLNSCFDTGLLHYLLPNLAKDWESPTGLLCQKVLAIHDEKMKRDSILPSHITGFTMVALPFFARHNDADSATGLWVNHGDIDIDTVRWLKDFYAPYQLPKYLLRGMRNILLVQPKMVNEDDRYKLKRRPNFRRIHDVYSVYREAVKSVGIDAFPDK